MRQRNFLWLIGLAGLALLVGALSWGMNSAYGGALGGYYAYSPILTKFVDRLPGVGPANVNNLGQYIPLATAKANPLFPNDDYYEIGIVQTREQMHTNLPGGTPGPAPCSGSMWISVWEEPRRHIISDR